MKRNHKSQFINQNFALTFAAPKVLLIIRHYRRIGLGVLRQGGGRYHQKNITHG